RRSRGGKRRGRRDGHGVGGAQNMVFGVFVQNALSHCARAADSSAHFDISPGSLHFATSSGETQSLSASCCMTQPCSLACCDCDEQIAPQVIERSPEAPVHLRLYSHAASQPPPLAPEPQPANEESAATAAKSESESAR